MKYIDDKYAFYKYLAEHHHCINACQLQEERRLKYAIARYFGKSRSWSMVLRDWRNTNFAKFFGYSSFENLLNIVKGEIEK